MAEQAWFNFATSRGDIIGQVEEAASATTVAELLPLLSSNQFIKVKHPVSPKATPQIIKACTACMHEEILSEQEEEALQQGATATCSKCNSGEHLTAMRDENNLRITYTSLTTLVDGSVILVGTNQISRVEKVNAPKDMAKIQEELYAATT